MKYIVQENAYHELDESELKEMFAERSGARSFEDWMKTFCERKYNSDFSREMSRSVQKIIDSFRDCD